MLQIAVGVTVACVLLTACSQTGDAGLDRAKLIGDYGLVADENQPIRRRDLESSLLKIFSDGTFRQECRYLNGTADSVSGTWSYSNRRVQFSVFKDCVGVWPPSATGQDGAANLLVELSQPTTILLSPDTNVRYERHG